MDLTTKYLGFTLRNPLVPAASPLSDDVDNLKRMEDAGAAAVILPSLFEEQLRADRLELTERLEQGTESFAEATSYFPEPEEFKVGPETYLDHIAKAKAALGIPLIASLNGSTLGGWTEYAKQIQDAGADALELNIYAIPTEAEITGAQVEEMYVGIVKGVRRQVTIPVSVKLSPFFTNFANMAKRLDDAGANGLVLFNRFYQPDIDLEELEVVPNILLSTPMAMRLPLRWIAILYGRVGADLAASSGVHRAVDAIKMLMAGASVTTMASALLRHGIKHLSVMEAEMRQWMEEHEYESVSQMQGSMSQRSCPDPATFERVQYMKAISTFKVETV
jgi:dihydroorotate dehydrogenase (fumarate)